MKKRIQIYTGDFETDPFEHGSIPRPFAAGLFDGARFYSIWGKRCVGRMVEFADGLKPGIIFFHNGGKFDFFYLLEYMGGRMMIVNGRIIRAQMGQHELRDSFAIMPFPLKNYKKDEIDYNKLHRDCREQHKAEILSYLEGDCRYLYELCESYIETFGDKLTIGSTSMHELQQMHDFEQLNEHQDKDLREQFYYGGRVQCFLPGIIYPHKNKSIKVFDVNSMYPHVMRDFQHPVTAPLYEGRRITKDTGFVIATGKNYGAFPVRDKKGINFTTEAGTFGVSIHEWEAAEELGLFKCQRIERTVNFERMDNFAAFVTHFYDARAVAKETGDKTRALFYKYVLNSAYGKFAQNPRNYFDYQITDCTHTIDDWMPEFVVDDSYIIWKHPSTRHVRHNVATAASITGAARAVLMRAIAKATVPIYCDTDSIICEDLRGVPMNETQLGAWKLEATGDRAAIAGKKLYAIFNGDECIKQASKGVKLTAEQIERVCNGEVINYKKDSPSFKWDGRVNFLQRRVQMTV